jgi:hypothetical protein
LTYQGYLYIDLDYTQNIDRDELEVKKDEIKDFIVRYMNQEQYSLSASSKFTYSLYSFVFSYYTVSNSTDTLKIEINFSNRAHIFDIEDIEVDNSIVSGLKIRVLNRVELIASKMNALITRATPRDVYDINNLISYGIINQLNIDELRKALVFYLCVGGNNDTCIDNVSKGFLLRLSSVSYKDIRISILPMIKRESTFDLSIAIDKIKSLMEKLFDLTNNELLFIDSFNRKNY